MTNPEVQTEAEHLIRYWKKQLRLEDWDITVHVPDHDPGYCAEISSSITYANAHMCVRNPVLHPPSSASNPDLEVTIVHELLHLRFHTVHPPENTPEDDQFELGIERTAQTLVNLNRGIRRD